MISVVVCTYNRDKYLPRCLDCLKSQEEVSPSDFEIVVVNNNCTDNTESICLKFQEDNPHLNFQYVKESNPGLSHARNKGIESAKGSIIAFIDDDGFACKDYVKSIKEGIEKFPEYNAYGGKVIPVYNEGKDPKWLSKYIEGIVSQLDFGETEKEFTNKYPVGCNMIFRKKYFEENGGFNTDLQLRSDEKYVFNKMKALGEKMLYLPKVYVNHFMDDFRLEKTFIQYLSKVVGNSEKVRLKDYSILTKLLKFVEYVFKYFAALLIGLGFILQGSVLKAEYIVLVRWNVLLGYFMDDVKKPVIK